VASRGGENSKNIIFTENFSAAQWQNPGKKCVSTQEKSDFAIAMRISKREYRSCA